jgi:hypothetical protein
MIQAPSSVIMVKPDQFGYNNETAQSNAFQKELLICDYHKITQNAIREFEGFVDLLRAHQINVYVFDSPKEKQAPDAVFPNNWISFHEDGTVILYSMLAENRRVERRAEIVDELCNVFSVNQLIDLSPEEENGRILEGTGSIIFDHINKIAYANESARTNESLFYEVCQKLGYEGVFFKAADEQGIDIYHTNVLMTIGDGFAVICKESIAKDDISTVINKLQTSGLEIIDISYDQMNHFAGNMIQLQNNKGKNFLVMSDSAFLSLRNDQKIRLSEYVEFIHADIKTIESIGGGSARCMIAGIHLPKK